MPVYAFEMCCNFPFTHFEYIKINGITISLKKTMNGFFNQFHSWAIAISDGKPHVKSIVLVLPGGPVVKHLSANAGDTGSIPGPGSLGPWGS